MKAIAILIVCLALLAAASPSGGGAVLAQEPPTMDTLNLSLWPEYDRPELLVIYRGQFAADAPLPLSVEFRIPAQAGKPFAVAYVDEQGDPIQLAYDAQTEGDWIIVTMQLPTRGFQFEYYLPLPQTAGNTAATGQRSIPFSYTADYAVTSVAVDVQEPLGVTRFALDPPARSSGREGDGLTYHEATAGPLAQNDAVSWTISYERTTAGLTRQAEPAATAAQPSAPATTPRQGPAGVLVVAGALLAMAAVGAGSYWFGKRNTASARPVASPGRSRSRRRTAGEAGAGSMFCYTCGTRLRPDADFCQQCGAGARKTGVQS